MSSDQLQEIMAERAKVYGTIEESFTAIAECWTAIVNFANGIDVHSGRAFKITPDMVALMMAQLKVIRASRVFHDDNYDDGMNYFDIARKLKKWLDGLEDMKREGP